MNAEIEMLLRYVRYEPTTGELFAIIRRPHIKPGDKLGCLDNSNGYLKFGVNGKQYYAHRVAWALTHGYWPESMIDHINGDKTDDRISNLRECNNSENMRNVGKLKNNTSGHRGVYWCKRFGRWRVQIQVNNRTVTFGRHDDYELACLIADAAREKYHGDFFGGYHGNS